VSGPVVLHGLDEVRASVGTALGPTDWVEITRERLDAFAAACPGAGTGWLALSLTNLFMPEMVVVEDVSAGLNVGTGEVVLGDELAAGARLRGVGEVVAADEVKPGAVQTVIRIRVEVEGAPAPAVTVDAISRWLA
jgi:acyl dehydratase